MTPTPASRIARLFDQDNDPDTAMMFRRLATERQQFADRLTELIDGHSRSEVKVRRTLRSRLFRLRLRIAELVPGGYGAEDDRRVVLRIAKRGSKLIRNAYADAQSRLLSCAAHGEVSSQAQAVETANFSIHTAAARAERR
ncbi:MAG: hypothetical protein GY926_09670 [bacterium]|nr:hypothetical protein [bacterium]